MDTKLRSNSRNGYWVTEHGRTSVDNVLRYSHVLEQAMARGDLGQAAACLTEIASQAMRARREFVYELGD